MEQFKIQKKYRSRNFVTVEFDDDFYVQVNDDCTLPPTTTAKGNKND